MSKLTKEEKNKIIETLDEYGRKLNVYEYGLPTYEEAQWAKMRELIDEALEDDRSRK